MSGFDEDALTRDEFLGGRLQIWQPKRGYRAATDPVFLAAACPAKQGERVLELGCGAGVASLCLHSRVAGLDFVGVERQAAYADLARRNAQAANAGFEVVEADLTALPSDLRQQSFDHVIANPPYYRAGGGTKAGDAGREQALREDTPLADWIATGKARLKSGGWLTLIHQADRLPDLLTLLQDGFGAISALPLTPRDGREATRIILRARKSAKAPFALLAPFVVHKGAQHIADGDDYSDAAKGILRDGAALN